MHEMQIVQVANERAEVVRANIKHLQGNLKDRTFDLADLLAEAQENSYPALWGYPSFKTWLDDSELDIKIRAAEYLIKIVVSSRPEHLNIPREQLRLVKISKLKAIFSLRMDEHADAIRELVKQGPALSLDEIELRVREIKGIEGPKGTWRNFYFEEPAAAETVDVALEQAKTVAGQEMSDASALEMVAAEFSAGYQETEEHQIEEIEEA